MEAQSHRLLTSLLFLAYSNDLPRTSCPSGTSEDSHCCPPLSERVLKQESVAGQKRGGEGKVAGAEQ